MKSDSTLKNINIENSETLDVEKKMSLSKAIAALIVDGIYEMPYTYDELFIRIYNKEYKVADFAENNITVYYDGENDVIYLDRNLLNKEDSEIIVGDFDFQRNHRF